MADLGEVRELLQLDPSKDQAKIEQIASRLKIPESDRPKLVSAIVEINKNFGVLTERLSSKRLNPTDLALFLFPFSEHLHISTHQNATPPDKLISSGEAWATDRLSALFDLVSSKSAQVGDTGRTVISHDLVQVLPQLGITTSTQRTLQVALEYVVQKLNAWGQVLFRSSEVYGSVSSIDKAEYERRLRAEIEQWKQRLNQMKHANDASIKQLTDRVASLQAELDALRASAAKAAAESDEALQRAQITSDTCTGDKQKLDRQLNEFQLACRTTGEQQKKSIVALQTQVSKNQILITTLEAQNKSMSAHLHELQTKYDDAVQSLEASTRDLELVSVQAKQLKKDLGRSQAETTAFKSAADTQQKRAKASEDAKNKCEADRTRLESRILTLERDLNGHRSTLSDTETKQKALYDELVAELNASRDQSGNLQSEVDRLTEVVRDAQMERDIARNSLRDTNTIVSQLQQSLKIERTDLDIARQQLKDCRESPSTVVVDAVEDTPTGEVTTVSEINPATGESDITKTQEDVSSRTTITTREHWNPKGNRVQTKEVKTPDSDLKTTTIIYPDGGTVLPQTLEELDPDTGDVISRETIDIDPSEAPTPLIPPENSFNWRVERADGLRDPERECIVYSSCAETEDPVDSLLNSFTFNASDSTLTLNVKNTAFDEASKTGGIHQLILVLVDYHNNGKRREIRLLITPVDSEILPIDIASFAVTLHPIDGDTPLFSRTTGFDVDVGLPVSIISLGPSGTLNAQITAFVSIEPGGTASKNVQPRVLGTTFSPVISSWSPLVEFAEPASPASPAESQPGKSSNMSLGNVCGPVLDAKGQYIEFEFVVPRVVIPGTNKSADMEALNVKIGGVGEGRCLYEEYDVLLMDQSDESLERVIKASKRVVLRLHSPNPKNKNPHSVFSTPVGSRNTTQIDFYYCAQDDPFDEDESYTVTVDAGMGRSGIVASHKGSTATPTPCRSNFRAL